MESINLMYCRNVKKKIKQMNETIQEHILKSIDVSIIILHITFCFENANNNMKLEISK